MAFADPHATVEGAVLGFFSTRKSVGAFVLTIIIAAFALRASRQVDGLEVDIAAAAHRDVFRSFVTASGEIVATRFADVGSSVMGRVVRLAVKEGETVRAGQTLAQIDPVQARSETAAAAALISALEAEENGARDQVTLSRFELEAATARALEAAKALARA